MFKAPPSHLPQRTVHMICISFYLNLTGLEFGFVSVKAQTADLCAEQLEGPRTEREEGGVGIKQIKHN
jgi:hypothetical protein